MSSQSPAVVLYDASANAIAVQNGAATPANTPAIMLAGSDGSNSRYITVDTSGRAVVVGAGTAGAAAGGVITIQGSASGTPVPVSGTVTASNASVSSTGSAPPASATYIGGSVTTAAPVYTTGQMSALSLNTSGGLRVDGSGVTQPISGTIAATQSGTWTVQPGNTANTTPWLATISQGGNSATVSAGGALKVDGSAATQPVSGTVAVSSVGGTVTVSGIVTTNKAGTSNVTSVASAITNTVILAANANRIAAQIYNNATKNMYIVLNSGAASTSNFTIILMANSYWELPSDWTGAVNAVWGTSPVGSCLVTEMSA